MESEFLISSGIEKFYTFNQFFTVAVSTAALLLTVFLGIFISSHMHKGRLKLLFIGLVFSFSAFLASETALAVSPALTFLRFRIFAVCTALFLFARLSWLFNISISKGTPPFRIPVILFTAEAACYLLLALISPSDMSFFNYLSFHRVEPGPIFMFFLADSIGWMLIGPLTTLSGLPGRRSRLNSGQIWMISGLVIFSSGIFFHHLFYTDTSALFLPSASLLFILCWYAAFRKFNLLNLYPYSFKEIIDKLPFMLALVDSDGKIISINGQNQDYMDFKNAESLQKLYEQIPAGPVSETVGNFLEALKSGNPDRIGSGRLMLPADGNERWLSYNTQPVLYWKKRVAWILLLKDVSKEERDLHTLSEQRETVAEQLRELTMYRNTGIYLELEKERESLIREINSRLNLINKTLVTDFNAVNIDSADNQELDHIIDRARMELSEIRASVTRMKLMGEEAFK